MDEDKSLREFTAKAVRPKKSDHVERHYVDLVASSYCLNPLDRTIRLVRAIFVFSPSKLIEHGIDPILIQKIKDIAIPLKTFIVTKTNAYSCYRIAWGIKPSKKNYEYFFTEWEINLEYYPNLLVIHKKMFRRFHCSRCKNIVYDTPRFNSSNQPHPPRTCSECGQELYGRHVYIVDYGVPIKSPRWSFFFDATSNALSKTGYQMLVNRFVSWADTVLDEPIPKLLSLVPKKYLEHVLQQLRELDKEGETDESSMD